MSVRESVERAARTRALAGDRRAGAHPRDRAWRLQLDFLIEHRRFLTLGWAALMSPVLLVWWFVPPFLQGLVLGGVGVGTAAALWSLVVYSTGTAPTTMGRQAEQWSAQELRRVRGDGWKLVNHLALSDEGDVDHLMIGPAGVLVVETKWSATSWLEPGMAARTREAQDQATARARQVRLWRPVKTSGLPVHPVVVLWGGGVRRSTVSDFNGLGGGALVLPGTELRDWVGGLTPVAVIDPEAVETLWRQVQQQVQRRDSWEHEHRPVAVTPQQWIWLAVTGFVTAWLVGFGLIQTVTELGIEWGAVVGLVVAGLGGLGLRRTRRRSLLRAVAAGVATGAIVELLLLAVFTTVAVIS